MPAATDEAILSAGLDLILARDARKKALVARPRPARDVVACAGVSERIPAHVRREVWRRDRWCCQWKTADGGICGSRYKPEFNHKKPLAQGGESTVENVRVLCRRHNLLAARLALGDAVMDRYTDGSRLRACDLPRAAPRPAGTGLESARLAGATSS